MSTPLSEASASTTKLSSRVRMRLSGVAVDNSFKSLNAESALWDQTKGEVVEVPLVRGSATLL